MTRSRKEKRWSTVDELHTWENCNEQHFNCYLAILLLISLLYRIHHKDGTEMRGRLISWEGREPDCLYYICWHWQAWEGLQKVSMTFPTLHLCHVILLFEFWIVLKKKRQRKRRQRRQGRRKKKAEGRKGEDKDKKKKGKNTSGMEGGIKKGVRWLPMPSS